MTAVSPRFIKLLPVISARLIKLLPVVCAIFITHAQIPSAVFVQIIEIPCALLPRLRPFILILLLRGLLGGLLGGVGAKKFANRAKSSTRKLNELTNLLCLGPQVATDQISS